ncbi:MAG: hypothetical protein ABUT39_21430 [Acidobacteriota bacterium]
MRNPTSLADYLQDWELLLAALEQNQGDLPQLEIARTKLSGLLEEARTLLPLQAAHAAAKQSTSQQLEAVLISGRKVATVIRFTIKEHYGNRNEKLTEFHLQPFRSRTVQPTLPPPESPAPAGPSSTPEE